MSSAEPDNLILKPRFDADSIPPGKSRLPALLLLHVGVNRRGGGGDTASFQPARIGHQFVKD